MHRLVWHLRSKDLFKNLGHRKEIFSGGTEEIHSLRRGTRGIEYEKKKGSVDSGLGTLPKKSRPGAVNRAPSDWREGGRRETDQPGHDVSCL